MMAHVNGIDSTHFPHFEGELYPSTLDYYYFLSTGAIDSIGSSGWASYFISWMAGYDFEEDSIGSSDYSCSGDLLCLYRFHVTSLVIYDLIFFY